MAEKIRVGIIGSVYGASAHAPVAHTLPETEVTAICTSRMASAEAAAAKLNIPVALDDYRRLLERPDVDLVVVSVKPELHAPMSIAALQAGKHVICEAQIAHTLPQARSMLQASEAAKRVNVVNMQARYNPGLAMMRRLVQQGAIGQPYFVNATMLLPTFQTPAMAMMKPWCGQDSECNGAVGVFGSHTTDVLLSTFGPVQAVFADTDTFMKDWQVAEGQIVKATSIDTASFLLRFESGVKANVQVGWTALHGAGLKLEVFGSEGKLLATNPALIEITPSQLFMGRRQDKEMQPVTPDPDLAYVSEIPVASPLYNVALLYRSTVAAIHEGRSGEPSFQDGARVQAINDAIVQSARDGCWVDPRKL